MLGMERREGEDPHICVRSLLPGATDAGVAGGFPAERSYSDTVFPFGHSVFPFVFGHSVSTTRLGLVALARVLAAWPNAASKLTGGMMKTWCCPGGVMGPGVVAYPYYRKN